MRDDAILASAGDARLLRVLELDGGAAPLDLPAFRDWLRAAPQALA
jgi:hypothetical protein